MRLDKSPKQAALLAALLAAVALGCVLLLIQVLPKVTLDAEAWRDLRSGNLATGNCLWF